MIAMHYAPRNSNQKDAGSMSSCLHAILTVLQRNLNFARLPEAMNLGNWKGLGHKTFNELQPRPRCSVRIVRIVRRF